jgi:glutaredoxin 3
MGRVTIFSLKDCSYCIRAKSLLKSKGVAYYEISLSDYPEKRDDLLRLAGGMSLPQIFFDETHIGGADALAALESEHRLDSLLKILASTPAVDNPALQRPDYPPKVEEKSEDGTGSADDLFCIGAECQLKETLGDDLRKNLDIRDRTYVFKTYKSCFLGSDLVDYIVKKFQKTRPEALLIGEQLRVENLFDHVTHDHKLEDSGNYYYRLAGDWHPMVLNTNRVWTNPVENPNTCVRLVKAALSPLLADHTDEKDGLVDYEKVFADKRFLHFEDMTCEFQTVDMLKLSPLHRKAFAINIYNLLALHAFSRVGAPLTATQRYGFF